MVLDLVTLRVACQTLLPLLQNGGPSENQLLLTLSAMAAVQDGVSRLLFGAVKTDSFHQDGSAAFFGQIGRLVALQEGGISIEAPALAMTSAEPRSGIGHSGVGIELGTFLS